jgi:hypothetical protein
MLLVWPPHMAYLGPQIGLQDSAYDDGEVRTVPPSAEDKNIVPVFLALERI